MIARRFTAVPPVPSHATRLVVGLILADRPPADRQSWSVPLFARPSRPLHWIDVAGGPGTTRSCVDIHALLEHRRKPIGDPEIECIDPRRTHHDEQKHQQDRPSNAPLSSCGTGMTPRNPVRVCSN